MAINPDKIISVELLEFTIKLAASYLSRNQVSIEEIATVVQMAHHSVARLVLNPQESINRSAPAVAIENSITENYIICFEDGKQLKMLKRHLKSSYNLTPEQYRERWNLSPDYPMVAPNYAKRRSSLAMKIGLGRKRKSQRQAA